MKERLNELKRKLIQAKLELEARKKDYRYYKRDKFSRFLGLDKKMEELCKEAEEKYQKILKEYQKLEHQNGY